MEEEKEKSKKFHILDIFRNKRYYAIANLSVWFIIIIVLIVSVRISQPSVNKNNVSENQIYSGITGFDLIKNKNFRFKYSLLLNNNKSIFDGKQRDDKVLINDVTNNKEYFIQKNIVLLKTDQSYVLVKNPSKYFNYIDVDLIEKILLSSKIEDGEYIISCENFSEIIMEGKKFDDKYVYINVIKKNNIITKIEMDLGEYINSIDSDIKSAKLELEYFDFNLIEDFDVSVK